MAGERVKEMRERKAWSQAHLADAAGLNIRTVQRIEAGEPCSYETMLSISAALDVDVSRLEPEDREGDRTASFSTTRAFVAAASLLPAAMFIAVNLLRSCMGIARPYGVLASSGQRMMAFDTFNAVSPFVFFGGTAVALTVCLPAIVGVRMKVDRAIITITGIHIRTRPAPIILTGMALLSAATLLSYVAIEQFVSLTR